MTARVAVALALPSPPGPRYRSPLRFIADFREDPLRLLFDAFHQWGDVVRFRMPLSNGYLLAHPEQVKHVLEDNPENYWKGRVFARLKAFTGNSLVLSEGDFWRRQRRIAQPGFRRGRIAGSVPLMAERAEALLEAWERRPEPSRPIDVTDQMASLALDIVARALFGASGLTEFRELRWAVETAITLSNWVLNRMIPIPLWAPHPKIRRAKRAMRIFDETIARLVAQRRSEPEPRDDLLGLLLDARDAVTRETMDDRQLRDELVLFLTAGHETTAMGLAWTFYLLSLHPEAEARLHAELDAVLGGRLPTREDLPRLAWTRQVVQESLRLYPPAWSIPRESHGADEIGGYRIEPRSFVFVSPYLTHRHPAFWEDPERLDPERFTPERSERRHRLAWLPFGAGPRTCIGNHFALVEMQVVLATLARRVRLELAPGPPVIPDPIFTLRPKHPLRMRVRPR